MEVMEKTDTQTNQILASLPDSPNSTGNSMENRRFPRYSNPYHVDMLDADNRPADEAILLANMSETGVSIETVQKLDIGQKLGFQMVVGSGKPLEATARVRWAMPMGFQTTYGLEIEGLGWFDQKRLRDFIAPDSFGPIEIADLVLQASSSMMAVYVIGDIIRSDGYLSDLLVFFLPFACLLAAFLTAMWFLQNR